MYTDRMTNDELERLYYSSGLPEIAVIYAQVADTEVERDGLQEEVEQSIPQGDYDKLQKEFEELEATIKRLEGKLQTAWETVFELRQRIETGKRLNKGEVLAVLNDLDLETP